MTKQEILNLIDTTIKPNNKKAISAQSLQNVLREMAEASGEGSGGNEDPENTEPTSLMFEVTYNELIGLRGRSELIPGANYRIIDYETTTSQDNTRSVGKLFDVVVTALDKSTISEDAKAMHSERDSGYFTFNKLEAWKIKYCLDNDKFRFEFACGGKCIKFSIPGYIDISFKYTGESVIQNNTTYYKWDMGYELDGLRYVYTISESPIVGDIMYADLSDVTNEDNMIPITDILDEPEGKGVIYEMIDEFGNQAPYDFKNIQFKIWSPSFGALFPKLYFESKSGYQESWYYTFGGDGSQDYSMIGINENTNDLNPPLVFITKYNICNNKIVYHPAKLIPINVQPNGIIQETEEENTVINLFYLHDNVIGNCEKSVLQINSNCRIRGCYNVCVHNDLANLKNNIVIDVLKGQDGSPIEFSELPTSEESSIYIGKNSEGEVKIWNPADLIA